MARGRGLAAGAPRYGAAEAAPSAEELAEALRLLTPSQASGAPQTLAEAGATLVEELSRGGGSRWVAEAVALSPEEASTSLEAEMFRTFATPPAGGLATGDDAGSANATVRHEEEEAAEAAVEAAEAGAEVSAAGSHAVAAEESPAVAASAAAPELIEPEQKDSQAQRVEEAPEEEEVAATTFADAVHRDEAESVTASSEAVSSASEEVSSSEEGTGGQEAMGKDAKGKGTSNWRQIHSTSAPAARVDVVEAAKQAEETPKAMAAAAAAADGGAADSSAIASIVDSVLADLRPRIVEEIAKKLAKKN